LESYKKFKHLDILPETQKKLPAQGHFIILWPNLGLKPQERVTKKKLDLEQASVGAWAL